MMKAIKNFMSKPITWGATVKLSGIVLGLYATVFGAWAIYGKVCDNKCAKKNYKEMKESNLEEDEI